MSAHPEESEAGAARAPAPTRWLELVLATAARRPLLWLALLAAPLFLLFPEAAPMRGDLEAHRLEASREMYESGRFVVPTLNGEPYLAKPPGQYWAIDLLSVPFGGVTLTSGRLLSALSSIGLVLLLAGFVRRELDGRRAVLAGFALLGSGILLEKGILAELEAPLALATAASLFALWQAVWDEGGSVKWTLVSGVAMGAAILVKGPVAPLFLGTTVLGMLLAGERRARVLRVFLGVLGIAVALAGIWGVLLVREVGTERALEVVGGEVVHRLHAAARTNREPLYYYLPALVGALGPAVLLLPGALLVRPGRGRARSRLGFLAGWSALSLVALSFSSGKEVRYLIATLPAWAGLIALALGVDAPRWRSWRALLRRIAAGLTWLAPLLVAVGGWIYLPSARPAALVAAALLLVGRLGVHRAARAASGPFGLTALLVMLVGLKVVWAQGVFVEQSQENEIARIGERVNACSPPDAPVLVLGTYRSTLDFVIDRPLEIYADETSLDAILAQHPAPACVLVTARRERSFTVPVGWQLLDRFLLRNYAVVHVHGAGPGFVGALGPSVAKKPRR